MNSFLIFKNTKSILNENEIALDSYGALMTLVLRNIVPEYNSTRYITFQEIEYYLTGSINITSYNKKKYLAGIEELDDKLINIISIEKSGIIIDGSKLFEEFKDTYYTTIDHSNFIDLMSSTQKITIMTGVLINVLAKLESQIWFNNSLISLAKDFNIDKDTLVKYLDELELNDILYVYRYDRIYLDKRKRVNNVYGLTEFQDKIDEDCNAYLIEIEDRTIPVSPDAKIPQTKVRKSKYDDMENHCKSTKKQWKLELEKREQQEQEEIEKYGEICPF